MHGKQYQTAATAMNNIEIKAKTEKLAGNQKNNDYNNKKQEKRNTRNTVKRNLYSTLQEKKNYKFAFF